MIDADEPQPDFISLFTATRGGELESRCEADKHLRWTPVDGLRVKWREDGICSSIRNAFRHGDSGIDSLERVEMEHGLKTGSAATMIGKGVLAVRSNNKMHTNVLVFQFLYCPTRHWYAVYGFEYYL